MTTAEAKKKPALQTKYDQEIVADLKERFGITNNLAVQVTRLFAFKGHAQVPQCQQYAPEYHGFAHPQVAISQ